jgi:hypothetical protein
MITQLKPHIGIKKTCTGSLENKLKLHFFGKPSKIQEKKNARKIKI